jgi:hypothetical protein
VPKVGEGFGVEEGVLVGFMVLRGHQ